MAAALMPETPDARSRDEIMLAVCERMAKGELVKDAAKAEGIDERTVRKWAIRAEYGPMYARARENQAHALAEETIRLADDESIPPESRRIRVDTRKWYVAKVAPKLYGDEKHHTVDISVSGLHLTALQAAKVAPAQLTAGDEIVVEALPDDGESTDER